VTSPVLLSTSRCSQTTLELSTVLSDSAIAFSGCYKIWCVQETIFGSSEISVQICRRPWQNLRLLHHSAGNFKSSREFCAALRETCCRILTAVILKWVQVIASIQIFHCYSHKIWYIIMCHRSFMSLYMYTYGQCASAECICVSGSLWECLEVVGPESKGGQIPECTGPTQWPSGARGSTSEQFECI